MRINTLTSLIRLLKLPTFAAPIFNDFISMTVCQLEAYFKSAELPQPFHLNPSHKILDVNLLLESNFSKLRGAPVPYSFILRPMYDRLIELKNLLESGKLS